MIACVRIPHFAASLHQRDDRRLADQPLVLVDVQRGIQTITGTSAEAAAIGVQIGMALRQAQTLHDGLVTVPADSVSSQKHLDGLLELLSHFSPLVEADSAGDRARSRKRQTQPSISGDEDAAVVYVDLGKLHRDEAVEAACSIAQMVQQQTRLDCAIALSAARFVSRIVAGPLEVRQVRLVPKGREGEFLAPQPVTLLPIYAEQAHQLSLLGLYTLGALAVLPTSAMFDLFGKQGRLFHRLAQGRETSPVHPYLPQRSEQAICQLDGAITDRGALEHILRSLAEGLAARLEQQGQVCGEIAVILRLDDGTDRSAEISLRQPTGSAEKIGRTLIDLTALMELQAGVSEVEVIVSRVGQAQVRQLSLFEPEKTPQDELRAVLNEMVARHGDDTFYTFDVTRIDAPLAEKRFKLRKAKGE